MTEQDYAADRIWKRVNKKLDLKKYKAAKTDKERRKLFKQALKKDSFAKNILKMRKANFQKLFDFGTAQISLDDGTEIKSSVKRFKPERQKRIAAFKGQLKRLKGEEFLLKKAEEKGQLVRLTKVKTTDIGRPTTKKVKLEGVTISKTFKLGKRTVRGIYRKGRRGVIALEEVEE